MDLDDQLALALQVVSQGAAAISYAALASDAVTGVSLSPDFTYKAVGAPLNALAGLLGVELPPPRARRPRRRRRPRTTTATPKPGLPPPTDLGDLEERLSSWDPDERPFIAADPQMESSSCRALLLEVVRRAAYDWVLYRTSSKLPNRMLADNAYHWLFVEVQEGSSWLKRQTHGKEITSFVVICEMLDLDPDRVRAQVRTMTERDIMGAGRPAERRRHKNNDADMMQSDDLRVFDVDIDSLPSYDPMFVSEG
jgi:hypothetical protein